VEDAVAEDTAEDMRRKVKEIERIAAEAEAEAVSEGGAVRVVVGAADSIKAIDLRLSAFEYSGVELGEMIVATIREANQKVQADLAERVGAIMGLPVSPEAFDGSPDSSVREEDYR
jgi:DNA-binding protein YbaB